MYFWIICSLLPLAIYWILTWNNSNLNFKDAWLNFLWKAMTLQQILMITFILGIWAGYSICKMIQNSKNFKIVSKTDPVYVEKVEKKPAVENLENENI